MDDPEGEVVRKILDEEEREQAAEGADLNTLVTVAGTSLGLLSPVGASARSW